MRLRVLFMATAVVAAVAGCGGSSSRAPGPAACSWHRQDPGPRVSEDLDSVSFPDDAHGWVVGGIGRPVIRATSDGGRHWRAQRFGGQDGLSGVSFVDDRHGWAVGIDGTAIATTDGGIHWLSEDPGPAHGSNLYGVDFINRHRGWIVGEHGQVLTTTDGGRRWQAVSVGVKDDLGQVTFTDVTHGWILATTGRVLRTADGGKTWTAVRLPTGQNVQVASLTALDAEHVWLSGSEDRGESNYGAISRTVDGGKTWTHYVVTKFDDERFGPVAFADARHGWVASPLNGDLWYTDDGGASWGSRPSPTADEIHGLAFRDPRHGWAVASNDTILACTAG